MIAQNLLDEDMPEMLSAKAQLTEQRKRDLDRAAIREDIISRAFLCPIVQDVVCKVGHWLLCRAVLFCKPCSFM